MTSCFPQVEAAHGIILPIERQIEPYDKRKFRLRVRPADPNERVYCFQTDTPDECTKWMEMLTDESKPSASRRGGLGHNHQVRTVCALCADFYLTFT